MGKLDESLGGLGNVFLSFEDYGSPDRYSDFLPSPGDDRHTPAELGIGASHLVGGSIGVW